ncbi:MAG: M23 family metallopeptidase [Novosphingobium sp.]
MRRRAVTFTSLSTAAIAAVVGAYAVTDGASWGGSPAHAAVEGTGAAHLTYSGELTQGGWIRGTVPAGTQTLSLDGQPVSVAPDGAWFAAFDRDAGPRAVLSMTAADGSVTQQSLTVAPRAWHIERINIPRKPGGPSEAFMKLRRPELAQIHAARAMHTGAQGWREHFIWPVKGRISGRFGSQRIYRGEPGSYHSGIDITTGHSGTPFVAPADGVVILAAKKPFTLEGNLLMIDHGMGLNSAFLHCSQILVKEGDHVKKGQVIGKIGMTGRATGPHLHWSIKWENARLDPLLFTGPMN